MCLSYLPLGVPNGVLLTRHHTTMPTPHSQVYMPVEQAHECWVNNQLVEWLNVNLPASLKLNSQRVPVPPVLRAHGRSSGAPADTSLLFVIRHQALQLGHLPPVGARLRATGQVLQRGERKMHITQTDFHLQF
jgi:hypothetical protein